MAIGRGDSLSRVPSADEWSALYGLAQKQALVGVCFYGMQRLPEGAGGLLALIAEDAMVGFGGSYSATK